MLPWSSWFADALVEPVALAVAWIVLTPNGRVNPSAFRLVMEITLLFALARPVNESIAVRRAVAWLLPATFFFPFARTLHPRDVIDDPALMLVFLCVVASVTTVAMSVPVERMLAVASRHRLGRLARWRRPSAGRAW